MSVPLVLGKYAVGKFLGRGSMGQAFLAHAPSGAEVVIKFMHPERAAKASFRKLFARNGLRQITLQNVESSKSSF